jgi:hypothetical protein
MNMDRTTTTMATMERVMTTAQVAVATEMKADAYAQRRRDGV